MRISTPYGDEWFAWIFLGVLLFSVPYGIWESWPPEMGDPQLCDAEEREYLEEGLALYGEAVGSGDKDSIRQAARGLDSSVKMGCLSLQQLETEKWKIEQEIRQKP